MKQLVLILSMLLIAQIAVLAQQNHGKIPDEIIKSTREFREHLLDDPYRPAYHFCIPEGNGRPGDPNGAFYHNGRYHLMYLYNRTGTGFCWGHISSSDLLNWRHHPDFISHNMGCQYYVGKYENGRY